MNKIPTWLRVLPVNRSPLWRSDSSSSSSWWWFVVDSVFTARVPSNSTPRVVTDGANRDGPRAWCQSHEKIAKIPNSENKKQFIRPVKSRLKKGREKGNGATRRYTRDKRVDLREHGTKHTRRLNRVTHTRART